MDPTQILLVTVTGLVMGWFALGTIRNIRRGNAVLRWMQGGLPRIGERTTLRWLGSSVVMLEIAKARPPFRSVELALALEPRDVPWFWLPAHLQGRRDVLILRARLARVPQADYDLVTPGAWGARDAQGRAKRRGWASEALASLQLQALPDQLGPSRAAAIAALAAAQRVDPVVWQLSSRRQEPHLELRVPLPDPRRASATAFFDALCALAEQMTG